MTCVSSQQAHAEPGRQTDSGAFFAKIAASRDIVCYEFLLHATKNIFVNFEVKMTSNNLRNNVSFHSFVIEDVVN